MYQGSGTYGASQSFQSRLRRQGLRNAPLVIDLGEAYTKCGLAGDHSPRLIIRTDLTRTSSSPTLKAEKVESVRFTAHRSTDEWIKPLLVHFKLIFFRHLNMTPRDHNVIVCENAYWPYAFKAAIAKTLFQLKVPAVLFLPSAAMPLYLTGKESGLVIDVGFHEARIIPVVSGFAVQHAMQTCQAGMAHVVESFVRVLEQEVPGQTTALSIEDKDDVACRTCFVTATDAAESSEPCEIAGVKVSSAARSQPANALFGDNDEGENLAEAVLESLRNCDVDCRASIVDNLVLSGGSVQLPGFRERLLHEMGLLLSSKPRYKAMEGLKEKFRLDAATGFHPNCMTFIATSLVGSMDLELDDFVKPEHFDQSVEKWVVSVGKNPKHRLYEMPSVIPDWTTALDRMSFQPEPEETGQEESYMIF